MRLVLAVALAIGACAPAHIPRAKMVGKVTSIAGVAGLIATAFATRYTGDSTQAIVIGFSSLSAIGIGTYATAELSEPREASETLPERHHRWARILTERAYGYARDGRCPRVRHIEPRVAKYDRELHDFVFMRDPEIQKCLNQPAGVMPAPRPPPAEAPEEQPQPVESPADSP